MISASVHFTADLKHGTITTVMMLIDTNFAINMRLTPYQYAHYAKCFLFIINSHNNPMRLDTFILFDKQN